MAIGENEEMQFGTIRELKDTPFIGMTDEMINKCQEELSKIKVLNYTSPDDEIPTDSPIDPSDDGQSKSSLLKVNNLLLYFIILLF